MCELWSKDTSRDHSRDLIQALVQVTLKFITLYVLFYSLNPFQTNGIFNKAYNTPKGIPRRTDFSQVKTCIKRELKNTQNKDLNNNR